MKAKEKLIVRSYFRMIKVKEFLTEDKFKYCDNGHTAWDCDGNIVTPININAVKFSLLGAVWKMTPNSKDIRLFIIDTMIEVKRELYEMYVSIPCITENMLEPFMCDVIQRLKELAKV